MGINSLEVSAQQINSTHSILQFEINGVQYTSTAVSTDSVVQCPSGQGRKEAFCGNTSSLAFVFQTYHLLKTLSNQ